MKWIDINDIAIELSEKFPEVDPRYILFTDLHKWVTELDDFDDEPNLVKLDLFVANNDQIGQMRKS